ncbi:MAG TPA: MraY family glycosyltransferase [Syntrophomonadaceae bacterium]|nr:MraY family glycosyltransferase [Syntrophomonadaceae bacterium]
MPIYILVILFLSVFVVAYFLTPLTIKLAFKIGGTDEPDHRKVHVEVMPRLGGLAIFVAFMIPMLLIGKISGPFIGVMIGATIIFAVGIIDDIYELSAWVKLIGQIIAASIAIYFGVMVHFVTNPFDGLLNLGFLSIPVTLIWIVGVTNAINLIDGLDGLAGGVSVIAAATMGVISLLQGQPAVALAALILVAAILGFLPYNFHPAKTFMGDSGSNLLGFILGCLAVMSAAKSATLLSLFVPIVILGIPIFDTFFAIVRRINNKAPIFQPDKDHLHHRLLALGMNHTKCVLVIYGISGVFAAVAIALSLTNSPKAMLVLALLLFLVVLGADKIGLLTGETPTVKTLKRETQKLK